MLTPHEEVKAVSEKTSMDISKKLTLHQAQQKLRNSTTMSPGETHLMKENEQDVVIEGDQAKDG